MSPERDLEEEGKGLKWGERIMDTCAMKTEGKVRQPAERVGVLGRAVGEGEDVGGSVIFKPLQREQC